MIRLFPIIFLIFLHQINAENGDERHEPYMRLKNPHDEALKTFLFADKNSLNDQSVIEKFLCPPETDEDFSNMELASKRDYKLKYCLFEKNFTGDEDRICKKEVKSMFVEITDSENNNVKICATTKNQALYSLSFYMCGDSSVLRKFEEKEIQNNPDSFKFTATFEYTNEICYDNVKKSVVWTLHYVQTPQLFQNEYFKDQHEPLESEISTDPYFMDANQFLTLKQKYESEKLKATKEPGAFFMVPHPLITPEHFALPKSKKATQHYINMTPLWEKLVPLMTAIDQGIKQAQLNFALGNPKSFDDILILTKVTTAKPIDETVKTWFNLLLFQGNIWFKFVYEKKSKLAVLITVHNTPGSLTYNGCIVGKMMQCEFREWTNDAQILAGISEHEMQYAYCCKVRDREIRNLFNYDYDIHDYLDIGSLLKGNNLISNVGVKIIDDYI